MKKVIFIILLASQLIQIEEVKAQVQLGMNGKISILQNYGIDLKIGYQSVIFNIGFSKPIFNGTYGRRMPILDWNDLPEEVYETGRFYNYMDLGLHYLVHKNILIGAKIGLGEEYEFQNCYDKLQILGANGYYHKVRYSGNDRVNWGFDLDYVFNFKESSFSLITGISWSKENSMGLNVGYIFSL
jgi:hypothetical protein